MENDLQIEIENVYRSIFDILYDKSCISKQMAWSMIELILSFPRSDR